MLMVILKLVFSGATAGAAPPLPASNRTLKPHTSDTPIHLNHHSYNHQTLPTSFSNERSRFVRTEVPCENLDGYTRSTQPCANVRSDTVRHCHNTPSSGPPNHRYRLRYALAEGHSLHAVRWLAQESPVSRRDWHNTTSAHRRFYTPHARNTWPSRHSSWKIGRMTDLMQVAVRRFRSGETAKRLRADPCLVAKQAGGATNAESSSHVRLLPTL